MSSLSKTSILLSRHFFPTSPFGCLEFCSTSCLRCCSCFFSSGQFHFAPSTKNKVYDDIYHLSRKIILKRINPIDSHSICQINGSHLIFFPVRHPLRLFVFLYQSAYTHRPCLLYNQMRISFRPRPNPIVQRTWDRWFRPFD